MNRILQSSTGPQLNNETTAFRTEVWLPAEVDDAESILGLLELFIASLSSVGGGQKGEVPVSLEISVDCQLLHSFLVEKVH